jgi:hypothetical protein
VTAPDGPQPAEVVVRISLGRGHTFTSERMALHEAETLTADLRRQLAELGDAPALVEIPANGYPELSVRANRITDIGIQRVGGRRRPAAASTFASGPQMHVNGSSPGGGLPPLGVHVMPAAERLRRDEIPGRVIG